MNGYSSYAFWGIDAVYAFVETGVLARNVYNLTRITTCSAGIETEQQEEFGGD